MQSHPRARLGQFSVQTDMMVSLRIQRQVRNMATKNVEDLLREGSGYSPLQKLLRHAANQRSWTDQLRAAVDLQLRHQIEVSDIKGSHLIINCRSAGVATKMRFLAPDLIPKLNALSAFSRIEKLVLKVLSANDTS